MTVKEAKEILDAKTFDTKIDAHVELTEWGKAKYFFEAYRMAKRSLEAWEKVIEEITELHDESIDVRFEEEYAYWNTLDIIKKHLSEVENET